MKALWRLGIAAGAGIAATTILARSRSRNWGHRLPDPIDELTRTLTHCDLMPDILAAIERSFTSSLGLPSAIFIPESDRMCVRHHSSRFEPDENDVANASVSISSGRPVAHFTRAPDLYSYFLPLTTCRGTLGSFGFRAHGTRGQIPRRTWALAESFANQTALAILRVTFEDKARSAEILA